MDVAITRYQQLTGEAAVHAETGQTFVEIQAARLSETEGTNGRRLQTAAREIAILAEAAAIVANLRVNQHRKRPTRGR